MLSDEYALEYNKIVLFYTKKMYEHSENGEFEESDKCFRKMKSKIDKLKKKYGKQ